MKISIPKRIFLLGMAALLFMSSAGIFMLFYAETAVHRYFEYKNEADRASTTFSLSKSEFASINWIGERDFVWKGKVYDSDGVSSVNGKIILRCHSDNKETEIRNEISDNVNDSQPIANGKPLKEIFKFFPLFPVFTQPAVMPADSNEAPTAFSSFSQHPQSPAILLNSPPPETC